MAKKASQRQTRSERARDKMRDMDPRLRLQTAEAIAAAAVEAAGLPDEIATPSAIDPSTPAARNQIRVVAPAERLTPVGAGGTPPSQTATSELWVWRGAVVEDLSEDPAISQCKTLRAYLSLDQLAEWHAVTAEVFAYECYFEVTDPTAPVPPSFIARYPVGSTWQDWGLGVNDSYAPVEIDGVYYRSNYYPEAQILPSTDWADFITSAPAAPYALTRVLSVEEFLQIRDEATVTP